MVGAQTAECGHDLMEDERMTAWLLEREEDGSIRYFCADNKRGETRDSTEATKFSSFDAAEREAQKMFHLWIAREHSWS
jgi:hypothetical protein